MRFCTHCGMYRHTEICTACTTAKRETVYTVEGKKRFCTNCQEYRHTEICTPCTTAKKEDVYTVESPKKGVEELKITEWAEGIPQGARGSITPSPASTSGTKSPIEPPHPKGQCHKKGQCKDRCRYPLPLKG